jgi:hypothetical protein
MVTKELETRFFRSRLFAFVLFALGQFSILSASAQDITVCSPLLAKEILRAHASFNEIYEFDVDKEGTPINIKPVESRFTNPADLRKCIAGWRFPASPSTHVVAVFEWQHAKGWTRLAISGPTVKLNIRLVSNKPSN